MSEIDTTILTDVRIYAQKLKDAMKNVVLQMQAEVNKRDEALSKEDREAAQQFQDKLHAAADEADALVKGLEPNVPAFLTQPYPEFAGNTGTMPAGTGVAGTGAAVIAVDRAAADEDTDEHVARPEDTQETETLPEHVAQSADHEDEETVIQAVEEANHEEAAEAEDETAQDENSDADDDMSPEARAIIEGFKRLTGGRPDPRMGWGRIPDRYK